MAELLETIESYYDLSLLKTLDPDDNSAMAEILTDMYLIHGRAQDRLTELQSTLSEVRSAWAGLASVLAIRKNFDLVTPLLNSRRLYVTDISDAKYPIRYMNFTAVPRASGRLEKDVYGKPRLFRPGYLDRLQIVNRNWGRKSDWHLIDVVGASTDGYEPLVEISIR